MSKKKIESTFVMRSDKLKFLKSLGFTLEEAQILKEELGKAKTSKA